MENPKPHGKSYNKWLGDEAKPSHRELLRMAIDNALAQKPESLKALFLLLQEAGIQVKTGKVTSLMAPGQKRFARVDTLGKEYSETTLAAALTGDKIHMTQKRKPT